MCLCGLYHGALGVLKSSRPLYPRVSVCFSILVTTLGEHGAGLCASRTFVYLFCACMFLSFFSFSRSRRLAAVCDCGIRWTFLLNFSKGKPTTFLSSILVQVCRPHKHLTIPTNRSSVIVHARNVGLLHKMFHLMPCS